jgi:Arc/MetJ-type ribon-helix-helix transcriptional regulator
LLALDTSLTTSIDAGIVAGMTVLRKITVQVPEHDLEMAQELTGEGVTETVRAALKKLASIQAQHRLQKLRGKVKFSMSLDELRYDRE